MPDPKTDPEGTLAWLLKKMQGKGIGALTIQEQALLEQLIKLLTPVKYDYTAPNALDIETRHQLNTWYAQALSEQMGEEIIVVYRGTERVAENQDVYDYEQFILCDAALRKYKENGYNLEEAISYAKKLHAEILQKVFGGDVKKYVHAHAEEGSEFEEVYGYRRTLISVTTDLETAVKFSGKQRKKSRVYKKFIPLRQLIKQTLSGSKEYEYLLIVGSDSFEIEIKY